MNHPRTKTKMKPPRTRRFQRFLRSLPRNRTELSRSLWIEAMYEKFRKQQNNRKHIKMNNVDTSGKYSPIPEGDFGKASNQQMVDWYNEHSGSSIKIKKFSDRKTAIKRCVALQASMDELAGRANGVLNKKGKPMAKSNGNGKKEKQPSKRAQERAKQLEKVVVIPEKYSDEIPRREGTDGWKAWKKIKKGMKLGSFNEADQGHILWDVKRGWLQLKTA